MFDKDVEAMKTYPGDGADEIGLREAYKAGAWAVMAHLGKV